MNSKYFVDSLSYVIDYYSNVYGNHTVIGNFNSESSQMYVETSTLIGLNSQLF